MPKRDRTPKRDPQRVTYDRLRRERKAGEAEGAFRAGLRQEIESAAKPVKGPKVNPRDMSNPDNLMREFQAGAAGADPGPFAAAWTEVPAWTAAIGDDVQDFVPYVEPGTTDLGELKHTPVRSTSIVNELQESPIDAVIIDDGDASR